MPGSSAAKAALDRVTKLRFRARALCTEVRWVEFALQERDGTAWGTNLGLPRTWRTVELPIADLKLLRGWGVPPGRGGDDDRLQLHNVAHAQLLVGMWLNPKAEKHASRFAIEELTLAP